MDWTPYDTKNKLIHACKKRNIFVASNFTRADMIDLLKKHDEEKQTPDAVLETKAEEIAEQASHEDASLPSIPSPTYLETVTVPKPSETASQAADKPKTVSPVPEHTTVPPKPHRPAGTPTASSVLDYLIAVADKVSYETIIKDCGPEAKQELQQLVKDRKVIQYRQHNKFWFQARYR